MELEILKKKLSTFKTPKGGIRGVSDDLLLEMLSTWESWTGTAKSFYSSIGISKTGMGAMIGKAKRLKREGHSIPFEEIKIEGITGVDSTSTSTSLMCDIEVQDNNKIIRFKKVDHLVEYLKKAA